MTCVLFNTKVQHQLVIRGNRSGPLPLLRRNKVRLACMKSKCQRLDLKRACCCRSLKNALAREVLQSSIFDSYMASRALMLQPILLIMLIFVYPNKQTDTD